MNGEIHREYRNGLPAALAPWLAFWGAVGVFRALLDFATYWVNWSIAGQALSWGAAAVTLAGALTWLLSNPASARVYGVRTALLLLVVLGSIVYLDYVHAIDAFFAPILRAIILAAAWIYAGASGQRGMLALGLWQLAAIVVLGVWYWGYAPLVLEGLSGLALLAAALLLQSGRRQLPKL